MLSLGRQLVFTTGRNFLLNSVNFVKKRTFVYINKVKPGRQIILMTLLSMQRFKKCLIIFNNSVYITQAVHILGRDERILCIFLLAKGK